MSDFLSCLDLFTPSFYLSPLATPDKAQQCLKSVQKSSNSVEELGAALVGGLIPLAISAGAGRLVARSAARLGAKAASAGRAFGRLPIQKGTRPKAKSGSAPEGNPCDYTQLGMELMLGLLPFGAPILISPVGTPKMLRNQCINRDTLTRIHEKLVDGLSDFLMDHLGPKFGRDLADFFGY